MRRHISQAVIAAAPSPSRNGRSSSDASADVDASVGNPIGSDDAEWRSHLDSRLDRLEGMLQALVERQTVKEWYSTDEVAQILGKDRFTVREWCRLGRIHAQKQGSGRGKYQSWVISHDELLRYRKEGLLPAHRD